MKDVLRSTTMECGEQFVMITGTWMMPGIHVAYLCITRISKPPFPVWFVVSLDMVMPSGLMVVAILAE